MLKKIKKDFECGKERGLRGCDCITDAQVKWLIERAEKYERVRDKMVELAIEKNHEALKRLADK